MDDAAFLDAFESATLTPEQWNHYAHLRMAYLYIQAGSFDEAIAQMRIGIQRLNQAHGRVETEFSGFHETLTVAWAQVLAAAAAAEGGQATFAVFIAPRPELLNKSYWRRYYSPEQIFTPLARQTFVAPDIRALPAGGGKIDDIASRSLLRSTPNA